MNQTSILLKLTIKGRTLITVTDTPINAKECKSLVGKLYQATPMVTSACVIAPDGKMVLDLAKNPVTLKQTKTVSIHLEQ